MKIKTISKNGIPPGMPRHAWSHLILDLKYRDENCRNHKTLAEEDMLGKVTKLASSCHGKTVIARFFDRFRLFLAMHWQKLDGLPTAQIHEVL